MSKNFPLLFSPLQVGKKTLRNRIVFLPHETHMVKNRLPSETELYYFRERAKGGAGMIIMTPCCVHPAGGLGQLNYSDNIIPEYQKIADAVHEYGTVLLTQFGHLGRKTMGKMKVSPDENVPAVAPSAIPAPSLDFSWVTPHELTLEELAELVVCYGQAARRVREGGLDGVELPASMGQLLTQFLSPHGNTRTDKYGGSLENRLRFPIEIIEEVRRNLGDDLILGVRLSEDFTDYSLSFEDAKQIAPLLEATGKIDCISVCAGSSYDWKGASVRAPVFYFPPGSFVYLAAGVKECVALPVICAGRIDSPELAEQALADGNTDLVGICRGLIADPYFPVKAEEGRSEEIHACIACSEGCHGHTLLGRPVGCIHNPSAGREKEWSELPPVSKKKKVVVVGAGPAGLAAATIAAERGHEVTVYENQEALGGQVQLIVKTPMRDNFVEIIRSLQMELDKLGVEIRLKEEATEETILSRHPDAVVLATGSTPYIPDIPGVDGENVITVWDAIESPDKIGDKVIIVDYQGLPAGSFTADFLAERNKKVTIITQMPYVGMWLVKHVWRNLYERLLNRGVEMLPFTFVKEIRRDSLLVAGTITAEERVLNAVDTVVLATGQIANDRLYGLLKGKVAELYTIGDCVAPRDVEAAIYEGQKVGRKL